MADNTFGDSIVGAPHFDIDELTRNPNSRVTIAIGSKTVVGFLMGNFSIGAGNSFQNLLDSAALNSLNDTAMKAQAVSGRLGLQNSVKFSTRTIEQTLDFWAGSEKPSFNIELLFLAIRETDDVRVPVQKLYRAVFPTFQSFGLSGTIIAPLGYLPKGTTASGTIAVKIGQWFRARSQIMSKVDFNFSPETTNAGLPLYASGSISFHPFRQISYSEISDYFMQPTDD